MTDRAANWIRTLWPLAIALVTIITLFAGLLARLGTAEARVEDHEARIRVLETCVIEATTRMTTMAEDITWMREHWRMDNDGGVVP